MAAVQIRLMPRFYRGFIALTSALFCLIGPSSAFATDGSRAYRLSLAESIGLHVETPGAYVHPNETEPELAIPAFQVAQEGVYVGVGSERTWIAAALAKKFTHLVLIDSDPVVNSFNLINLALLKIARSREDYLWLRYYAHQTQVMQRASEAKLAEELTQVLSAKFAWWNSYIRSDPKTLAQLNWHQTPASRRRPNLYLNSDFTQIPDRDSYSGPFKTSSYLHLDGLFQVVKKLADEDRVTVVHGDLGDRNQLYRLGQHLVSIDESLSFFDVSNAWDYLSEGQLKNLHLFLTVNLPRDGLVLFTGRVISANWSYLVVKARDSAGILDVPMPRSHLLNLFKSRFPQLQNELRFWPDLKPPCDDVLDPL